jgi:ABC-2 type transport system permease protein
VHAHRGRRGERDGGEGAGDHGHAAGRRGRGDIVRVWPIYKKELRLYFSTPLAWAILFTFMLVMGFFFSLYFRIYTQMSIQMAMNPGMGRDLTVLENVIRPLFSGLFSVILFLSLMPAITMRLFSEEFKNGTLELLLTYPVSDTAIVIGKFLGGLSLYLAMLVSTLAFPAILWYFAPLEWGALASAYLGLLIMGAAFLAVGMFISSLTENQIIAALGTFTLLIILWAIGWGADAVTGPTGDILRHLSVSEHLDNFMKGVIESRDVVYFLNLTVVFLVLSLLSLQRRRWKG